MNTNRISALLRYDWMINKRKAILMMTLITLVYACLVVMFFSSKSVLEFNINQNWPYVIGSFIFSYFKYAEIAMVFFVTTILHFKFTNPRSATTYLTLPGSSAEKWFVLMADYVIAAVAVFVLALICYLITMIVCWMLNPEISWFINPISFFAPNLETIDSLNIVLKHQSYSDAMNQAAGTPEAESVKTLVDSIMEAAKYGVLLSFVEALAYIYVNMFFRTNGQLKTIAIFVALSFLFVFVLMIYCLFAFGLPLVNGTIPDGQGVFDNLMAFAKALKWLIYSSPALMALFAWLIYKKICKKEAK